VRQESTPEPKQATQVRCFEETLADSVEVGMVALEEGGQELDSRVPKQGTSLSGTVYVMEDRVVPPTSHLVITILEGKLPPNDKRD